MKKLFLILALLSFAISSCTKERAIQPTQTLNPSTPNTPFTGVVFSQPNSTTYNVSYYRCDLLSTVQFQHTLIYLSDHTFPLPPNNQPEILYTNNPNLYDSIPLTVSVGDSLMFQTWKSVEPNSQTDINLKIRMKVYHNGNVVKDTTAVSIRWDYKF